MQSSRTKGVATVIVIVVVAILGMGGAWLAKPSWFPGASKRAANSTKATEELVKATDTQGAFAAASVVKIGEANAIAPESPAKSFIAQEVPHTLSLLPAPDPKALIEAERRKAAVLEGRLDEARRLYEASAKEAAKLQREKDEALEARRNADLAHEKAAAAEHAKTLQMMGLGAIAFLLLAGWAYTKFYSISPAKIGGILADIRAGVSPTQAFDTHINSWLHPQINREVRLATPVATDPAPSP